MGSGIWKKCVLAMVMSVGAAHAAIPDASYSAGVSNARMAYLTGAVSEASCTSSCTRTFVAKMPTGYSSSAAAIWMNFYYLEFADAAGGNINHAKLSSTPGTGSISGQGNHGLLRPSTSINFDGDFQCFTGFLY